MNFEVDQMALYLPYKLKCKVDCSDFPRTKFFKFGLNDAIENLVRIDTRGDIPLYYVGGSKLDVSCNYDFKPILKFKTDLHYLQDELLIEFGGGVPKEARSKWIKEYTDNLLYSAPDSLSYSQIKFMAKNHIDIFGMINKGLALNIELFSKV